MIQVNNVCFSYQKNKNQRVLNGVSLDIPKGGFVVLLGQSGSGKTTLLNVIAGLQRPDSGEVRYDGVSIYDKTTEELCKFRSRYIGFVFQNYFLENRFSAGDNVMLPLLLNTHMSSVDRIARMQEVLGLVGLGEKIRRKPSELSGGECQRVSIARALANSPDVIIADEPTGNLDTVNGQQIINLLKEQTKLGRTVLMVTHNENYISYADKVYKIRDGNVSEQ